MIIEKKFWIVQMNGKKTIVDDATAKEADINKFILSMFSPQKGDQIPVMIIAGKDTHDRVDFDLKTAAQIFPILKLKGAYISTFDDGRVKIFTLKANGDYPVSGLDPDGYPRLWDANGNESSGDEKLKLYINIEKKQPGKETEKKENE